MQDSELNPYRTPELDEGIQAVDELSRTKFRRIISTIICTGAAFWCVFPAVAFLERILPADATKVQEPIGLAVVVLLTLIGIAAFLLGLCIRHNQKRYVFSLFMVILTLFLLFPWLVR